MTFKKTVRRGQNLILFALTMLLVTLIVLLTLSFGSAAKDKMELQNVADAAAYSDAVSVARTFNSFALLNRAQIAHMVAIAGVQSAISYTSLYMAILDQV